MTTEELAARIDTLEDERDRLLGFVEHLAGAVERLARLAGAAAHPRRQGRA